MDATDLASIGATGGMTGNFMPVILTPAEGEENSWTAALMPPTSRVGPITAEMTGSRRPIGEPLRPLRFAYATTEVPADYDTRTPTCWNWPCCAVSTHPNRERIGSMLINPGGAQACVARRRFGSPPRAPDAAVKFGP
jgi:hypothetical protein